MWIILSVSFCHLIYSLFRDCNGNLFHCLLCFCSLVFLCIGAICYGACVVCSHFSLYSPDERFRVYEMTICGFAFLWHQVCVFIQCSFLFFFFAALVLLCSFPLSQLTFQSFIHSFLSLICHNPSALALFLSGSLHG